MTYRKACETDTQQLRDIQDLIAKPETSTRKNSRSPAVRCDGRDPSADAESAQATRPERKLAVVVRPRQDADELRRA